jgi:hypothetical protein
MLVLFAETSDGGVALLVTLSSIISGAAVWVANYLAAGRKEKRANDKEDEASIVSHLEKLVERQGRELDELRKRADAQNKKTSRLIAHMGYLEGIMSAKGIKFRPFSEEPTGDTDGVPIGEGEK